MIGSWSSGNCLAKYPVGGSCAGPSSILVAVIVPSAVEVNPVAAVPNVRMSAARSAAAPNFATSASASAVTVANTVPVVTSSTAGGAAAANAGKEMPHSIILSGTSPLTWSIVLIAVPVCASANLAVVGITPLGMSNIIVSILLGDSPDS